MDFKRELGMHIELVWAPRDEGGSRGGRGERHSSAPQAGQGRFATGGLLL